MTTSLFILLLCVRYHGGVGGVQHGGAVAVEERSHLEVLHLVEGHRGDLLVQDICKINKINIKRLTIHISRTQSPNF
jgi:hypothetical protein